MRGGSKIDHAPNYTDKQYTDMHSQSLKTELFAALHNYTTFVLLHVTRF